MANAMFCRPGTKVVEIIAEGQHDPWSSHFCAMLGLDHVVLFQRQSAGGAGEHASAREGFDLLLRGRRAEAGRDGESFGLSLGPDESVVSTTGRRRFKGTEAASRALIAEPRQGGSAMQVKYRSFTPGLNPRRTKLEVPGWGGNASPKRRVDGAGLALPPVFGRGSLRHRTGLPLSKRTACEQERREAFARRRFRAASRGAWRRMAAVPTIRRSLLHLPGLARSQGRRRMGNSH